MARGDRKTERKAESREAGERGQGRERRGAVMEVRRGGRGEVTEALFCD